MSAPEPDRLISQMFTGPVLRLALGAGLLAAGWLVLRDAANRAVELTRPAQAAPFWPASGNALSSRALERMVKLGGASDDLVRADIARAMARTPSAGLPLALAGLDASAAGDLPRATDLMEAARRRSPRIVLVRAWLFNEYVRTARYDLALAEAGPVMRLSGEMRPQVYSIVRQIAASTEGRRAVEAALALEPDWAGPYRQWLASQPVDAP